MKSITPMLTLAAGALLFSGTALAQTQTQSMPAASSSAAPDPGNINGSVTFHAKNGSIVTVKSYQPSSHSVAPPPSFSSLDTNGNGSISVSEAAAYPPLANGFEYADSNHNKSISKSEYARWVKQP